MAKRYRCLNPRCSDRPGIPGHEFVSDEGKCDKCGTRQDDTRTGRYIHTLKVLHYDPPSAVEGVGKGYIACDPQRDLAKQPARYTGFAPEVNCPACRETEEWKQANKEALLLDEDDFPVAVNLRKGVVAKAAEKKEAYPVEHRAVSK